MFGFVEGGPNSMDEAAGRPFKRVAGETGAGPIVGGFVGGGFELIAASVARSGGDLLGVAILATMGLASIGIGRAVR